MLGERYDCPRRVAYPRPDLPLERPAMNYGIAVVLLVLVRPDMAWLAALVFGGYFALLLYYVLFGD